MLNAADKNDCENVRKLNITLENDLKERKEIIDRMKKIIDEIVYIVERESTVYTAEERLTSIRNVLKDY